MRTHAREGLEMRRILLSIGVALLLSAPAVPAVATPIIDWDPGEYYAPGTTTVYNAPVGDSLWVVGTISAFGGTLAFLNPTIRTYESTFYLSGMSSTGTGTTPFPPYGNIYVTPYAGGTIEIYEDTSPEASFDPNPPNATVPSNFRDGTLILSGTVSNMYWQTNDFPTGFQTGISEANILWTGGAYFDKVQRIGGEACPSLFTGGITWRTGLVPVADLSRHDGKIYLECPTPAQNSTWGRLKSLYR